MSEDNDRDDWSGEDWWPVAAVAVSAAMIVLAALWSAGLIFVMG